jgi:hypothetical protein
VAVPRGIPLPVPVLLVLVNLSTNLTTRALAALFATSQSTLDRIIDHLIPVLAAVLRPTPDCSTHPWIIDDTLIPVHDQSITAISKNYRPSVNTEILINANNRRVIAVGPCWPGNRNDVVPDGPRRRRLPGNRHHHRSPPGTRRPDHPRPPLSGAPAYPRRLEHVTARIKDRQILRQCRHRGQAINHTLHIITGPWNLKGCGQLRLNS